MIELIPILLATVALLGAIIRTARPLCIRQTWEEVARWLHLEYQPARFGAGEVAGRVEGISLRVRTYGVGMLGLAGRGTCIVVDLRDVLPDHVVVRPLGVRMRLPGTQWWPAVTTGDSHFDASVAICGDEIRCTALAHHSVRELVLDFVRRREWVAITDGRLVCMVEGLLESARLCQLVRRVLDLARRVSTSTLDLANTLSENAQTDASHRVRRRSLRLLVRDFPDSTAAERALRACLHDPDPLIRSRAARELGADGKDAHVRMLRDCAAPVTLRVAALQALAPLVARVELVLHVERAIRSAEPALWAAAARLAAAHDLNECIPPLGRRAIVASDEVAADVAYALGTLGDCMAEPWLLQLLRREGRPGLAAANALAAVGTLRSVQPLLGVSHGMFRERALKHAARTAVEQIRARTGAEPGRVSVARTPALQGALSFALGGGELSTVEPTARSRSVPVRALPETRPPTPSL